MNTKTETVEQFTIKRTGQPPIRFLGGLIGNGSTWKASGCTRWTVVSIYRTAGGNYVAEIVHRTQWEGESDRHEATSKAIPAEIIDWLRGGEDQLGKASQEAIEAAVKVDDRFAEAWQEIVD